MASYRVLVAIWLLLVSHCVVGHIPMRYFNSAEPDAPIYVPDPSAEKISRQTSLDRLTAVRAVLSERGVDAYIVPTADAHNSQYIAPADARREWVSGLRGSSGTAVVTASTALVWTDARYFTQFYVEVDVTLWTLMRQGTDASVQQWLIDNLPANSVVGIDPTTYTRNTWTPLETALNQANITLLAIEENLVDIARRNINDGPPSRPSNPLLPLTVDFTGRRASEKLSELWTQIQNRGASALILTALDEVAYTLNLRGTDIPYNPVFFAYLVLRPDVAAPNNVILFWNAGVLSSDVQQHLASEGVQITVRPYGEIFSYLRNLANELPFGSSVWLSEDGSHAIYLAVENDGQNEGINLITTVSPVALMKVVKNQVELQGFRNAHIKDGVAVVRSLHWVHKQVDAGVPVTEVQLSDQMEIYRGEEQDSMGPSFATIAGAGENGAIIHYKPVPEGPQRVITKDDMLLVDSGGQYRDGTTDITRTRHMSASPTPAQRLAFTRVLKGQINLGTAVFPAGTLGHVIEVLARKSLWDVGLNYGHGTGHGVGHFLNVHEGPTWILSGPAANDPGIRPNMIYSNEPGYYEVDEYGVRHEDLVETIAITRDADHPFAESMVADFEGRGAVGFYTISLAPHQTACLDIDLLTDFEIKYINDYHARVLSTLGPILQQRGLTEEYEWLEKNARRFKEAAPFWFGRSSRPQFATEALEVEAQWADSIEAWRRKLNLSQFVLLGHSLGGYIATAYALKYSERVRHLIVADPWGYNEPTPYSKHSLWSHLFITSTQLLNPMWAVRAAGPAGRWLVSKTRPDIPEKFKILPDAETLIPDYIYQCNSQNPSGEAAFRTMGDQYVFAKHPMSRRIHELHPALPFTGIYGDKSWMPCAADIVKKMRPNSSHYTKILKDAGHFVYLDNPEEFNNTVLETCAYADKCDPQIAQRLQANKRVERLHAIRDDQSSINISKSYQSHNSKRRVKIAKIGNKSQNEITKSNLCKILCVSLHSSLAVMLAVMQTKCGYTILSVSP